MDQDLNTTNPAPAEGTDPPSETAPAAATETAAPTAPAPNPPSQEPAAEPEGQGALQQAFWRVLEEEKRNLPQHLLPLLEKLPKAEQLAYLLEHRQPLGLFGSGAGEAPQPDPTAWQSQPAAPATPHAANHRRALYQNF